MKAICTILAAGVVIGSALLVHAEMVSGIQPIVHDPLVTQDDVEGVTAPAHSIRSPSPDVKFLRLFKRKDGNQLLAFPKEGYCAS